MDVRKLLNIQSELNEFTLTSCNVFTVPAYPIPEDTLLVATPLIAQRATMRLAQRDGIVLRHHSPVVQMCDMYQWAGNRELSELIESNDIVNIAANGIQNSRVEVVDIMHFDLSLLILTCATEIEIIERIDEISLGAPSRFRQEGLIAVRQQFDDLQLRKWWTTKTIEIASIRLAALDQFATLMAYACNDSMPLFAGLDDVEATYLKKVDVNYKRIKSGYDHVSNKEQGNASI